MRTLVIASLLAALVAGCTSQAKKSPFERPSIAKEAEAPSGFYIIQPGDTGLKIAAKHDLTLADLIALNPEVQWTKLKAGQLVRIVK